MNPNIVSFIYLVAGVLFILGIKGLTKPKTAVRGNLLSALGMLLAVVITFLILIMSTIPSYCWCGCGFDYWRRDGAADSNDVDAANGCSAQWLWWWRVADYCFGRVLYNAGCSANLLCRYASPVSCRYWGVWHRCGGHICTDCHWTDRSDRRGDLDR